MTDHLSLGDVARLVALLGERPPVESNEVVFTLEEVAAMTKMSFSALRRDVRAGKFEHVHRGDLRGMTREQITKLIQAHTEGGGAPTPSEPVNEVEEAREATRRSGAARQGRRAA